MKRIASLTLMLLTIAGCDKIGNPENPEQPGNEKMYIGKLEVKFPDNETITDYSQVIRFSYNSQDQITGSQWELKYHDISQENPEIYNYSEISYRYLEDRIEANATYSYKGWEKIYDKITCTLNEKGLLDNYEIARHLTTQEDPIREWIYACSYEDEKVQKISDNNGLERIFTWKGDALSTIKIGNEKGRVKDEMLKYSNVVNNTNIDLNWLIANYYLNMDFISLRDAVFMNYLGHPYNTTLIEDCRQSLDEVDPSENAISDIHFEYLIDEDGNISEITATRTTEGKIQESRILITYI